MIALKLYEIDRLVSILSISIKAKKIPFYGKEIDFLRILSISTP